MPEKKVKKKEFNVVRRIVTDSALGTVDLVEDGVEKTVEGVNSYMTPIRDTVLKRYPILFSLLVIYGASMTILGFEYVLHSYGVLEGYPWTVFIVGILVLLFTGKLYKALNK